MCEPDPPPRRAGDRPDHGPSLFEAPDLPLHALEDGYVVKHDLADHGDNHRDCEPTKPDLWRLDLKVEAQHQHHLEQHRPHQGIQHWQQHRPVPPKPPRHIRPVLIYFRPCFPRARLFHPPVPGQHRLHANRLGAVAIGSRPGGCVRTVAGRSGGCVLAVPVAFAITVAIPGRLGDLV